MQKELIAGGKLLNAVKKSCNLTSTQKHIMSVIGSWMPIDKNFDTFIWVPIKILSEETSLSRSTISENLKLLSQKGYLIIRQRHCNGRQLANYYGFTSKVFEEYKIYRQEKERKKRAASQGFCDEEISQQYRADRQPDARGSDCRMPEGPGTGCDLSSKKNLKELSYFSPSEKEKLETEVEDTFEAPAEPKPEPRLSERIAQERERQSLTPVHTEAKPTPKQTPISKPQTKATSHPKPNPSTVMTPEKKRRGELAKERREINEAIEATALIFRPCEQYQHDFFDIFSVKAAAKIAYERYGLEPIISLRNNMISGHNCGRYPFDIDKFLNTCRNYSLGKY